MAVIELNCIYIALRKASRRCDNYYSALTKEYNITPPQLHILYQIYLSPGNNKDLAEKMELSRSGILRELVSLVDKNLVFRHGKNLNSINKNYFSLTKKGNSVLVDIFSKWKKMNASLEKMIGMESKEIISILNKAGPAHSYKYISKRRTKN